MDEAETALREILPRARALARKRGKRNLLWPVVFDAESVLSGTPTAVEFSSRQDGIERLLDLLRGLVGSSG